MTTSRNGLRVLAAALGAAWLAAAPVHAETAKGEAKQECKELLQDKGYKGVDVDQAKRTGEDRTRVEADARKNGPHTAPTPVPPSPPAPATPHTSARPSHQPATATPPHAQHPTVPLSAAHH